MTIDTDGDDPQYAFVKADSHSEHGFEELYYRARKINATQALPFWDVALSTLLRRNADIQPIATEVRRHNKIKEISRIHRDHLSRSSLDHVIQNHLPRMTCISSRAVGADGDVMIPMIDFHCRRNEVNYRNVRAIVRSIGLQGSIIDSGASYHFIGSSTVSNAHLRSILGQALLFTPYVDRSWIAHQLIQGECLLRISPSAKYGRAPLYLESV